MEFLRRDDVRSTTTRILSFFHITQETTFEDFKQLMGEAHQLDKKGSPETWDETLSVIHVRIQQKNMFSIDEENFTPNKEWLCEAIQSKTNLILRAWIRYAFLKNSQVSTFALQFIKKLP